ncbi:cyclin-dependent kinase 4 [Pholidichthys leucotaenia]
MSCDRPPLPYLLLAKLGEGHFGKVYKARELQGSHQLVALKKLKILTDIVERGIPASMIREVALLKRFQHFNHPNIVRLLDAIATWAGLTLNLTLVLEYVDEDLRTFLSKVPAPGLSRGRIKGVMLQVLRGLDFLHINMVMHRDLKPENILINSGGEVKISDFGLARIHTFNIALTPRLVTLWYRAPELLLDSVYMSAVDMWSAGCVFAELFLLRPLLQGKSELNQLHKILILIGMPSKADWPKDCLFLYSYQWGAQEPPTKLLPNLGPHENDLLSKCLVFRPSGRISAARALVHPFFTTP